MPDSDPASFVDPALKEAVVRAWGGETAPPGLADRVRSAMADAADAPIRFDTRPGLRLWGGLALAAILLLTVGISYTYFLPGPSSSPQNAFIAGGIPVSFVNDVISTHDRCGQKYIANHHNVGCDKSDYHTMKRKLEEQLGHRVWVTPVAGWEFRGAAACRTGDGTTPCSHLLFERPDRKQTLSVFSVPYNGTCSLRPTDTFAEQIDGHPVAGFVDGKELHCLVGHSPDRSLTVEELKRTTETYRTNLHALHVVYPQYPATPTHVARSGR